jgi:hypothetical protein
LGIRVSAAIAAAIQHDKPREKIRGPVSQPPAAIG